MIVKFFNFKRGKFFSSSILFFDNRLHNAVFMAIIV